MSDARDSEWLAACSKRRRFSTPRLVRAGRGRGGRAAL